MQTTAQDAHLEQARISTDVASDVSQVILERLRRRPEREDRTGLAAAFVVSDLSIILGAGLLAYSLRGFLMGPAAMSMAPMAQLRLFGYLLCYALLTVICNAALDLYSENTLEVPDRARWKILKGFLLSSMLTIVLVFLMSEREIPRPVFGAAIFMSLFGLLGLRHALQRRTVRRVERGIDARHVLIVGAGQIGQTFQHYLESTPQLGKMFCGFVDETRNSHRNWLGTPDELPRLLREYFIDEIYFTPEIDRDLIMGVAAQARRERLSVKVVPELYGGLALGAGVTHIGDIPVLELHHEPIPVVGLMVKRVMDLVIASLLMVVTAPIMLLAAIAIKLDSQGPVFYTARRVGRKGRKFLCYKFRTMVADADARKDTLRHMNERCGATFKIANDPRITRVGRFLRKYSIDELPQLFNVLKREMSIVGPRPHPVDDYHQYQLEDLRRLDVLPGITGLWQVSARRDPSFEKNVLLDLEYIDHWNTLLDIKILLRTIPEVFKGSGH
ncbi:MAG TPA: sugar transferase [Alphaproteobacteria bacterium]|nr:sugar transferase [Alphaproteobacteria bacterium]